jgi:hypothetical protein
MTSHMLTLATAVCAAPRAVFGGRGAPGRAAGPVRHRTAIMTAARLGCATSCTVSAPRHAPFKR